MVPVEVGGEVLGGGLGESFSGGEFEVAGAFTVDDEEEADPDSLTLSTPKLPLNRAKRPGRSRAKKSRSESEDRRIPGLCWRLVRGDGSSFVCPRACCGLRLCV